MTPSTENALKIRQNLDALTLGSNEPASVAVLEVKWNDRDDPMSNSVVVKAIKMRAVFEDGSEAVEISVKCRRPE